MRKCKELKCIARGNLSGNYGSFMVAMILASMIPSAILIPFNSMLQADIMGQHIVSETMIIYFIAAILVSLVSCILQAGQIKMHLNKARNQNYQISDIFGQFRCRPDRFIVATVLVGLLVLACLLPLLIATFLVFVVPTPSIASIVIITAIGLICIFAEIYVALRFSQFLIILADNEDLSAIEGLKQSWRLMSGKVGRLFYIGLSFIGITLLATLSFGIAYLWIQPYMIQTQVQFYMDITGETDQRIEDLKRMDEEMGPMMEY